uniref:Uncharacterized protein n=1 Tax=Timema cristinae TaxID=61476 RepID=A0A7R9H8D4_TIMCR|nr:unnamed protein product [Timema cristinae]
MKLRVVLLAVLSGLGSASPLPRVDDINPNNEVERILNIRNVPEVPGYSSNLYEVYMEPYGFVNGIVVILFDYSLVSSPHYSAIFLLAMSNGEEASYVGFGHIERMSIMPFVRKHDCTLDESCRQRCASIQCFFFFFFFSFFILSSIQHP